MGWLSLPKVRLSPAVNPVVFANRFQQENTHGAFDER